MRVLYRHPSNNLSTFTEYLDEQKMLKSICVSKFERIMILGDVNVDHKHHNQILDVCNGYDRSQLISEPTRIAQNSQKIIDVIYTNNNILDKIIS